MKWFAFLLGPLAWAAPSLLVVAVERTGLPPYEGTERVYRLEGPGCRSLRVGEVLVLRRQGDPRSPGRLEVLSVHLDHARTRLSARGETFPLKGDLALRMEPLQSLPAVPVAHQLPIPSQETFHPRAITLSLPRAASQDPAYQEPIYFLKGDASLSPGALAKLRAWVETWGPAGRWSLECPQAAAPLSILRIEALRSELLRLGVPSVEIRSVPEEPQGQYDAIRIKKDPS